MVDELKLYLNQNELYVFDKIFIYGYSINGHFANRYSLLHPDRVQAVAAGGLSGLITLPFSSYAEREMNWYLGVNNFESITGLFFDFSAYENIPQYYFWGENDLFPYHLDEGFPEWVEVWGSNSVEALTNQCAFLSSQIPNATCHEYPGIGHDETSETIEDIFLFFEQFKTHNSPITIVLTNASPNHTITAGTDVRVYGTSTSNQIVLESNAKAELLNFPGQNSIQIQTSSSLFTVSRSGSVVSFEGSDGTFLKIPATTDTQTISFNGAESRVLQIQNNQVMLDDQVVVSSPIAIEDKIYGYPGYWVSPFDKGTGAFIQTYQNHSKEYLTGENQYSIENYKGQKGVYPDDYWEILTIPAHVLGMDFSWDDWGVSIYAVQGGEITGITLEDNSVNGVHFFIVDKTKPDGWYGADYGHIDVYSMVDNGLISQEKLNLILNGEVVDGPLVFQGQLLNEAAPRRKKPKYCILLFG
jgi:hypothetical protein